jgi:transcriptional regulator
MYLPAAFEEAQPEVLQALIADHPLGALVTLGFEGLTANHIPFLFDAQLGERGSLIGHVARKNAAWHDFNKSAEALVIFQGSSAYISPNWYPTKQETHEVVPTYNYAVVHVHGNLIVHDDAKWLRGLVGRLTKEMESRRGLQWKMADASMSFIDDQLRNIVGIEVSINRIVGKWKASQNRVQSDRVGAAEGLRAKGDASDAEMANLIIELLAT